MRIMPLCEAKILMRDPIPSMNKVYSLFLQDEKQKQVGNGVGSQFQPSALYSNSNIESQAPQLQSNAFYSNSNPGSQASSSSQQFQAAQHNVFYSNSNQGGTNSSGGKNNNHKERPICSHCRIVGHIIDECYKLHGYPPGYKFKGKALVNQVSNSAMINSSTNAVNNLNSGFSPSNAMNTFSTGFTLMNSSTGMQCLSLKSNVINCWLFSILSQTETLRLTLMVFIKLLH